MLTLLSPTSPAGLYVGTKSSLLSRVHWSSRPTSHERRCNCVFHYQALLLALRAGGERLPCEVFKSLFRGNEPCKQRDVSEGLRAQSGVLMVLPNTSPLCPVPACWENFMCFFLFPLLEAVTLGLGIVFNFTRVSTSYLCFWCQDSTLFLNGEQNVFFGTV